MKDQLFKNFSGTVESGKLLADVAAYRIGGPARFFLVPNGADDIAEGLRLSAERGIDLFILGSGTNLLVADRGFDGVVLWLGPHRALSDAAITIVREDATHVWLRAPASYAKAKLLDFALAHNYGGLEFSAGIPGSLGGAVYMNAGTKWGSYGEVITEVDFVSNRRGVYTLTTSEIGFKYRGLGEGLLDGATAVSALTLRLQKNVASADLFAKVDEIYSYRGLRQPLELPNCGSVFKNPVGSAKGAGRLIEAADLKGKRVGAAEVSLKHANFILNTGNAKARDVHGLIQTVQARVLSQSGITLEPEVIFVGRI